MAEVSRAARAAVGPRLGGSGRAASAGPAPSLCGEERSLLPCLCRQERARGRPPGPLQPLSLSLAPPSFLCGIVGVLPPRSQMQLRVHALGRCGAPVPGKRGNLFTLAGVTFVPSENEAM
ncbi:hypothetical protein NN561_007156 [Cricetulus griseus]